MTELGLQPNRTQRARAAPLAFGLSPTLGHPLPTEALGRCFRVVRLNNAEPTKSLSSRRREYVGRRVCANHDRKY
jgi:hypothetical protein